jgi:hypothetical protein
LRITGKLLILAWHARVYFKGPQSRHMRILSTTFHLLGTVVEVNVSEDTLYMLLTCHMTESIVVYIVKFSFYSCTE